MTQKHKYNKYCKIAHNFGDWPRSVLKSKTRRSIDKACENLFLKLWIRMYLLETNYQCSIQFIISSREEIEWDLCTSSHPKKWYDSDTKSNCIQWLISWQETQECFQNLDSTMHSTTQNLIPMPAINRVRYPLFWEMLFWKSNLTNIHTTIHLRHRKGINMKSKCSLRLILSTIC